jgi:putative tricarboxylic transport membrane protein
VEVFQEEAVKNPDIAICAVLAAILLVFVIDLGNIASVARIYPIFVLAGSYVMIAIVLAQSVIRTKKQIVKSGESEPPLTRRNIARISIYCAAILAYIILIDVAGYIASTVVFGLFSLIFLGNKNKSVLIILPAAFAVLMYFVFDKFLYVQLPAGLIAEKFF